MIIQRELDIGKLIQWGKQISEVCVWGMSHDPVIRKLAEVSRGLVKTGGKKPRGHELGQKLGDQTGAWKKSLDF